MKSIALTDVGQKRLYNQDYVFATSDPIGALPNLFIVADGMGGENAGDYASMSTVTIITDKVQETTEGKPISILEQAITTANKRLYLESKKDPLKAGMGTTIVAAVIDKDHLYVANVGDSRLYVSGPDKLTQITRDHSVVAEMVRKGTLTEEEAKSDPRKHMITRALAAEENIRVDYFDVKLTGCERILMCSDGLTNMIEDEEIYSILDSLDYTLEQKAKRLISVANEHGGKDNISAVVVEPFN